MEVAEEDVSLPWRWILEHFLDMKDIGTPILREMISYVPNLALYSSLQKRTALRYLEEAIAGDRIDVQVIPLVAALLKESQATSSYPSSSDYSILLLRVQVEAVITHIRGKPRDWRGFSQALDRIFPEDTVDAQSLKKREELLTLLQAQGQEKKRGEVLETYSLTALRRDLLKCITLEKARLERTFLDTLLQDVVSGKYSTGSIGKYATEKEESQEDFHSADGQRDSIDSDDQTVIGGRNSNVESEEAVETTLKDSDATHMTRDDSIANVRQTRKRVSYRTLNEGNGPTERESFGLRDDSIAGVHQTRKRVSSQTFIDGNGPTKRKSFGHLDLRQRDQHGKAVTSSSPMKGGQESNSRPPSNEEVADDSLHVDSRPPSNEKVALEVADDFLHVEFLEVGRDGHEEFCHKCKEGGRLLCCDGCPIAVHRRCLGFESKSFTEEEWFCPLCLQKRAVEAVAKAREEELAAKQRVLSFMTSADGKRHTLTGSKRELEQQSGMKSVLDETKILVDCEGDSAKTGFKKLASKADVSEKPSNPLKGAEKEILASCKQNSVKTSTDLYEACLDITTEEGRPSRPSFTSGSDTVYEKDHRKKKKVEVGRPSRPSFTNGSDTVNEKDHRKGKEVEVGRPSCPLFFTNGSDMVHEKNCRKGKKDEEPKMQDATCNEIAEKVFKPSTEEANGFTSIRHTNVASSSKPCQSDQVENSMEQANIQVQVGDGDGHDGDLEEDSEGGKSESPQKRKDRRLYFRGNRIIPGMRRKRLRWSKVEEETLKEGVERFSRGNGGWGFQWTRILEFGEGKFHPSRTDVDLKDKWRNLAKRGNDVDKSP